MLLDERQPHREVGQLRTGDREQPRIDEQLPLGQAAHGAEIVAAEEEPGQHLRPRLPRVVEPPAREVLAAQRLPDVADEVRPREDDAQPGLVEIAELALQPVGPADVVGREQRDVAAARRADRRVGGVGGAAIGSGEQDDARIVEAPDDRRGAVARPVVHDHQLEIADGLREHTVDRLGDMPGVVVRRHRDGDEWRARHHGVLTAAMPAAAIPLRGERPNHQADGGGLFGRHAAHGAAGTAPARPPRGQPAAQTARRRRGDGSRDSRCRADRSISG